MERPSSTAATMVAKLSSARTMSAASLATSVPAMPMAKPTSARLSAGASFVPSREERNFEQWVSNRFGKRLFQIFFKTYTETNLRYSQVAPITMYEEKNTGTNLPAQIDIYATEGDAYKFLFITKGGGSANKSMLFQETKALLNPESIKAFMIEKIK